MAVASFIISLVTFLFTTVFQFVSNSPRARKEATLNAYRVLQTSVFSPLNRKLTQDPQLVIRTAGEQGKNHSEDWETLTDYLTVMEHFAVGVNTGIYSLAVLTRLGGPYFLRIYHCLLPLIERKRHDNESAGAHYHELEKMIEKLKQKVNNSIEGA